MRHFNNFNDSETEEWEVMKEFAISFKGEAYRIQLICTFITYPEYFFFIKEPEENICLMGKLKLPDGKTFWNSRLSQEDAQDLAALIEKQTNNPFRYKGDIHIRIYSVRKDGLTIRKAKAPFGNDMYYQVIFDKGRTITFGKFHWSIVSGDRWRAVEPLFAPEDLEPFISLV